MGTPNCMICSAIAVKLRTVMYRVLCGIYILGNSESTVWGSARYSGYLFWKWAVRWFRSQYEWQSRTFKSNFYQILDDKSLRVVPISQDLKHFLYKLQLPYFKDPNPSKSSPKEEKGAATSIRLHNVPVDLSEENFRKELPQIKSEYTLKFYTAANKPDRKSAVLTFKSSSDCESAFNQLKGGVGFDEFDENRPSRGESSSWNTISNIAHLPAIPRHRAAERLLLCEEEREGEA